MLMLLSSALNVPLDVSYWLGPAKSPFVPYVQHARLHAAFDLADEAQGRSL